MKDHESDSLALVFLEQFWADRDSGRPRSLDEYLRLFPGDEETIAREYLEALAETREGDEPGSGEGEERIGPYRLVAELGRGGQGIVWIAEDTRLGRRVALKVLTGLGPGAEAHLARFKREAALASKLDHPGICAVHDTGIESGVPYIAMRLVDGESLADRLDRFRSEAVAAEPSSFLSFEDDDETSSPPPEDSSESSSIDRAELHRIVTFFEKIALALHAAHEAGIVHRDIKPGNIMLTADDEPVILDFGMAQDDSEDAGPSLTQTGDLFGTPAYMSPEQITGRRVQVDRRSDIYSLGITLYECLTTKRPFAEATRESLYQAILSKDAQPVRKLNRRVPADLEVVLQCAMEKDRDRRYQTAADMAEELRRIRANEPIVARPVGPVGRAWRWAQRKPATAALLVTLFVALVAIATITSLNNRRLSRLNTDLEGATTLAEANAAKATRKTEEARRNLLLANEESAAKDEALREKTEALSREKEARAAESRALAEKTSALSEYQRMADTRRLTNARADAEAMWPEHPSLVPDLEAWQQKYAPLFEALAGHAKALEALRAKAPPYSEAERARDFASEIERVAVLERQIKELEERIAGDDMNSVWAESLERRIERREDELEELTETMEVRPSWDFGDDVDLQFRHDTLTKLVADLTAATAEESSLVASVARRLDRSRRIRRETLVERAALWEEAGARIASNPRYGGLTIVPQLGLIPLGPDPASGLEEFLDWRTHDWSENEGALPERGEDGRIAMTETRGLIFVLIPGGAFWMGAQRDPEKPNFDPQARPNESPVCEVVLAPYFISKYEMTQGQWSRFDETNPSRYGVGFRGEGSDVVVDKRHPVEQLIWGDCRHRLACLGLLLPTEAQWERAARAGAEPATCWAGTSDVAELARFANISGREAMTYFATHSPEHVDGFIVHAPVGSFAPNAFGLFDVMGNVWEMCRDGLADYAGHPAPGDGLRQNISPVDHPLRAMRGGSFYDLTRAVRLSIRVTTSITSANSDMGVRPSRSITAE